MTEILFNILEKDVKCHFIKVETGCGQVKQLKQIPGHISEQLELENLCLKVYPSLLCRKNTACFS